MSYVKTTTKKSPHAKKSQAGFTIVGVLVASAILGILTLAILQVITDAQKGQKSIQYSTEFNIFRSNIQKIIDNRQLCATAFREDASTTTLFEDHVGTYPGPVKTVRQIRIGAGPTAAVLAEIGTKVSQGMNVSRIEMRQMTAKTVVSGRNVYLVELIFEATKEAIGYGGSTLSNRNSPFLVTIQTDAANRIVDCGSTLELPVCAAGQSIVARTGGGFQCGAAVPTCAPGQFLLPNGSGGMTCGTPPNEFNRYGGSYQTYACDGSCRPGKTNPFTGGCSCPAYFFPTSTNDFVDVVPGTTTPKACGQHTRYENNGMIEYQCIR